MRNPEGKIVKETPQFIHWEEIYDSWVHATTATMRKGRMSKSEIALIVYHGEKTNSPLKAEKRAETGVYLIDSNPNSVYFMRAGLPAEDIVVWPSMDALNEFLRGRTANEFIEAYQEGVKREIKFITDLPNGTMTYSNGNQEAVKLKEAIFTGIDTLAEVQPDGKSKVVHKPRKPFNEVEHWQDKLKEQEFRLAHPIYLNH